MIKMKCALELQLIKENAQAKYELEQSMLDEQAKLDYHQAIERAVNYCETTINDELVTMASRRTKPYTYIEGKVITDRLGNRIFCPLHKDLIRYANGRHPYSYNSTQGMALQELVDYLKAHCLTVQTREIEYYYNSYRTTKGLRIIIEG